MFSCRIDPQRISGMLQFSQLSIFGAFDSIFFLYFDLGAKMDATACLHGI